MKMIFPKIVALTGRKGHGKDTAAKVFLDRDYQPVKFAGCLKGMIEYLLLYRGATYEEVDRMIEGDLKEVKSVYLNNMTPRWAMQSLGTEWGRCAINKELWADATLDQISMHDKVIVTDLRFHNELDALRTIGATVLRIYRPEYPDSPDTHASEKEIDMLRVDAEVINDGTRGDLYSAVFKKMQSYLVREREEEEDGDNNNNSS